MQHGTSREVSAVLVQGLSWCQVVAAELYPGLWPEVHLHRWQQELLAVNGGQQQQRRHETLDDGSGHFGDDFRSHAPALSFVTGSL